MRQFKSRTYMTILVALIATFAIIFSGCTKKPEEKKEETIKIGAILPLTGNAATYGENCKRGMMIASDEFHLNLIYEDSAVDAKKAINAFNKLINIDKVRIVVGDMFSSTTLAFAPVAQKNEIIVLSPTAGAEDVPKTGNYIFSLYPSGYVEGAYMVQSYSKIKKGEQINVGIIHTQEQVYTDIAKGFKRAAANEDNVKVIFTESLPPNTKDFKNIIAKYMKKKALNTIYLSADKVTVSNFIKQSKQLQWNVNFLSQSTLYDASLLDEYGDVLNGVIFTGPYFDINNDDKLTKTFVSLYRKKFNTEPDVWAAYGYDAIMTIKKVLDMCPKCGNQELANKLKGLKTIGVTGKISFNEFGGAIRSFKLFIVKDNKFEVLK